MRKQPVPARDALKLARECATVYGYLGQKEFIYHPAKNDPGDATLEKILIGRSGTLRAPCLRVGNTFVGGWNKQRWRELLKIR